MKDTKTSEVPRQSTNNTSSMRLILAPPAFLTHKQSLRQNTAIEGLKMQGTCFVNDWERNEQVGLGKMMRDELGTFSNNLNRWREEKMFCDFICMQ